MDANANSKRYIAIATCAFVSHFLTLWGRFVFDDSEAIVKNKDVLPETSLKTVFLNDFWGTNIALNASHKSYRPFTILSYRLNVFFSNGRLDAFQFHTANVVLHGILSIMALPFFECVLKRKKYRKSLAALDDPAFTGALLFAVHPVHCEAVAALVGRADILAGLLFVFVINFYKVSSGHFFWCLMVFVLTGCAVLCKETAITVLGVCVVYEIYFRKRLSENFWIRFTLLSTMGTIIMFLRLKVMNFEGPTFSPTDNPAAFADKLFVKVFSYSYIYLINIMLLIWPQWLCFDWSMGCMSLIESFHDYRCILVILFWILGLVVVQRSLKRCFCLKLGVTEIGLVLLVVPFIPSSNLLFKVGFVIAERNLLLPSLGFSLLVAVGLQKLKSRVDCRLKSVFTVIYLVLIATFILRSMQRNYDWLTEERLFKSALNVCPLNAKVHYNIAKVAADNGNKTEALARYEKALELYPNYEQAMNNLANLLRESGQMDAAEMLLWKAVEVRPNFAAAWMNLGIVLSGRGRADEAEVAYKTAIKHRSKYADAQYNLGNLYLDMNRHDEALAAWKEAVSLRPSHVAAWGNALALLDSKGQVEEAVALGVLALNQVPKAPSIHFALANALGKLRRFPEAEFHFQRAIVLNQNNALYYSNLGVLYHRWEKKEKARQMYLKALKLDPNLASAKANLGKLDVNKGS